MKPIKEVEQPEKKMWSVDVPRKGDDYVPGFYWRRDVSTLAVAYIEITKHGYIYHGRTPEHRLVADLLAAGGYEFLGPISPSDTEELLALREAADVAHKFLLDIGYDKEMAVCAKLRKALGKE